MIDAALLTEYRKMRRPHTEGAASPQRWRPYQTRASEALRYAKAAIEDKQQGARFERIGAWCYTDEPRIDARKQRAYNDYGNDDEIIRARIVLVPDWDAAETALDFDCCGAADTGAAWRKCDCVVNRYSGARHIRNPRLRSASPIPELASVYDEDTNRRQCQYGQPCKHKCDQARRIEQSGGYGIVAEARDALGEWHETYACWGFVDEDWKGSGYDTDAIASALDFLDSPDAAGC